PGADAVTATSPALFGEAGDLRHCPLLVPRGRKIATLVPAGRARVAPCQKCLVRNALECRVAWQPSREGGKITQEGSPPVAKNAGVWPVARRTLDPGPLLVMGLVPIHPEQFCASTSRTVEGYNSHKSDPSRGSPMSKQTVKRSVVEP